MNFLRQNTGSQEILLGPFVDDTDGKTAETGLTIANTDIKLFKHGATTLANKNSGGATHISNGNYYAVLDATDSNTLGILEVIVQVSGALPVRRSYTILTQEMYDTMVAGSATLPVNVTQFGGSAGTFASGRPEVNVSHFGGSAGTFASGIPQASLTTSAINAVADQTWDEAMSGHVAAGSFGARMQANHSGTMQAGSTSTTAVLASGASASNDYYNNALLLIVAGTGAGQSQYISDYVGSTRTCTMNGTWITTPDNTSVYAVLPGGSIPGASAPSASDNATAVWNALVASYTAAGSFGERFQSIRRNTAQAGTLSSITLDASASATNDYYRYAMCYILSGTGAGQARQITAYTQSTKVANVSPSWTVAPDATSVFLLLPLGIDAATVSTIAAAVWEEARGSHGTAGTFGEYVLADVRRLNGDAGAAASLEAAFDGTGYGFTNCTIPTVTTVTNAVSANVTQISGDGPAADALEAMLDGTGGVTITAGLTGNITGNVSGSIGSVTGNVGGNVVGTVGSVVGAVGSVTAGVTVTTNNDKTGYALSGAGVDAIWDEAVTEPSGVFAWASATPRNMIAFLAQMTKNKQTLNRTTGAFALRNNADSGNVGTATHADDGTTTTKGAIS